MAKMLDWSLLQSFIAVAGEGSLSGAARALGGSQPTMGRHVGALEAELGVRLFERAAGGFELTPTGVELLDQARRMARPRIAFRSSPKAAPRRSPAPSASPPARSSLPISCPRSSPLCAGPSPKSK